VATEVLVPLAGSVWDILVEVGDQVEEDDEIIVIEALKMETFVYAPCDGRVSEIRVQKGDAVEEDDVLMIIEDE